MEKWKCTKCKIEKPLTAEYFHRRKNTKRGFVAQCKECRSQKKEVVLSPMKECSRCKVEKPRTNEYFHITKANRDGLAGQCKKCRAEISVSYIEKNKEGISEYQSQYHINNREIRRINGQKWYQENREEHLEYSRQYHQENKEELNKSSREWYQENKETHAEYMKKHYQENREQYRMNKQRRRARVDKLPHTLTDDEWEETKELFNNSCAYCGIHQEDIDEALNREHIVPVVNDGGFTKENIIPSCNSCNSSKGTRDMEEWYREQEYFNPDRLNLIHYIMNNKQQCKAHLTSTKETYKESNTNHN